MREIKFRIWCKQNESMQRVSKIGFDEGKLWYVLDEDHETQPPYFEDDDDWVLMQYTGLKDKNGKEIYEGDILKTPSVSGKGDIITTIEWNEFSWKEKLIYSPIHQFYEYFDFSDETGEDSEVIGNIYENPELLEESQNESK
ncbi:hypothetical protein FC756_03035 [Lysinibacillus mangiferihumi]|uniref:YopX protein domain-containing protein n=1 Tax=Lysinibacillus mangiferihumi TaxID=1130819 RepID=A0A4U2ZCD3_9BACI|nr:YopX family protein [Lysinibacillus mangiferihumi]TKI71999.1 hypothetical protein FC756_03035 [Lysinibacillus mangiferihumi]